MRDLHALPLPELFAELLPSDVLQRILAAALHEDLANVGDVTTDSIIDANHMATAAFVARQPGVVSGIPVLKPLCATLRRTHSQFERIDIQQHLHDGDQCSAGETLATISGNLRTILAIERTALNLLCRMSGIATLTAQYVEEVAGTRAVICDTRKTMPGLRALDKYAVRCGGGTLHRVGLFDAALYKDNHLAGIAIDELRDQLTRAVQSARAAHDLRFVEVEVDSLQQLEQVLIIETGLIDIVLLDNFSIDELHAAVSLRADASSSVQLEASGGVSLETVSAIAHTGVDRISVGALTHSSPHLDLGLDVQ